MKFESNGKFSAPDKPCEEGRCSWRADAKAIIIEWGDRKRGEAGTHKITAVTMKPEAGNKIRGQRRHDGDRVSATFVSRDEVAEEDEEFYLYKLLELEEVRPHSHRSPGRRLFPPRAPPPGGRPPCCWRADAATVAALAAGCAGEENQEILPQAVDEVPPGQEPRGRRGR